jgi:hypothetical protein
MSELTREQLLTAVISGRGSAYLRGVDLSTLDLSNAGWLIEADLRYANLSQTNLARANLKKARLKKANLQGASLFTANLEAADISKAKLNRANLRMANLCGANLEGASLVRANLIKANLRESNLEGADLEGANLEGADLGKAKLNRANLKSANLKDANLQGAGILGTILDENRIEPLFVTPLHGFAGTVSSIQLTDLVQLLCLTRQDFLIRVEAPSAEGIVHIRKGKVQHAQSGSVSGEEAFLQMLHWENGRFETLPLEEGVITTIHKPLEHLIVESMRQRDEKKAPSDEDSSDLLDELKGYLPIPAYPLEELVKLVSRKGKDIRDNMELQISDVFDTGEGGGIFCSLMVEGDVFTAPLEHLRIKENHPLTQKLADYGVYTT